MGIRSGRSYATSITNRDTLSRDKIDKRLGGIDRQITKYLKHLEVNDSIGEREEELEELAEVKQRALAQIARLQEQIEELLKKKRT